MIFKIITATIYEITTTANNGSVEQKEFYFCHFSEPGV